MRGAQRDCAREAKRTQFATSGFDDHSPVVRIETRIERARQEQWFRHQPTSGQVPDMDTSSLGRRNDPLPVRTESSGCEGRITRENPSLKLRALQVPQASIPIRAGGNNVESVRTELGVADGSVVPQGSSDTRSRNIPNYSVPVVRSGH